MQQHEKSVRKRKKPKKRSGAEIVTAKPAIEKMKSVANVNHLIAKGGKPGEKKDARPSQDRSSRPAPRRDDAAGDVAVSKPTSHRGEKKNKEKEHDKFSKLERGGRKGGKPQSLEKQVETRSTTSRRLHQNRK